MKRLEKTLPIVLACILLGSFAWAGSAEDAWTTLVGKKFAKRPAFSFVKGDPELPNILIYGDSISMGYTQRVRENLKGKANVYRIHCNVGGNIIIKNNHIIYTTENGELWAAIQIKGVPDGVVIKDNTIESELEPEKRRGGAWVVVEDSGEVEMIGNKIVSEFEDVSLIKRR